MYKRGSMNEITSWGKLFNAEVFKGHWDGRVGGVHQKARCLKGNLNKELKRKGMLDSLESEYAGYYFEIYIFNQFCTEVSISPNLLHFNPTI